jgi:hypothetical protein
MRGALHVNEQDPTALRTNADLFEVNRVQRSRTVSPDLMYFAFSIIFTSVPHNLLHQGWKNKMYVGK